MIFDVIRYGKRMSLDQAIVDIVKKCRKKPHRYRDGNRAFLHDKNKPPKDFDSK